LKIFTGLGTVDGHAVAGFLVTLHPHATFNNRRELHGKPAQTERKQRHWNI